MQRHWQALRPFNADAALETIGLEARASWQGQQLELELRLRDPADLVDWPAASAGIERRDNLWQATCFEAFFSEPGAEHYWELNLAPNGHWNAYRLQGYRAGLEQEGAIAELPYSLRRRAGVLNLQLSLNLLPLLPERCDLDLSITSVLALRAGGCSYWALRHSGSEADFHRRDSFLRLECLS